MVDMGNSRSGRFDIEDYCITNTDHLHQASGLAAGPAERNFRLLPEFLLALVRTYGYRAHYLALRHEGAALGLAACFEKPDIIGRPSLMTVPGGFWAVDETAEKALIREMERLCVSRRLRGPILKDLLSPLLSKKQGRVVYRALRPLPEDSEKLWASYTSNLRRKVRKAEKNGFQIVTNSDVDNFHSIWAERMRDLGTPPVPRRLFRNLASCFGGRLSVMTAYAGEEPAGGALIVRSGKYATDLYFGSRTRFFSDYLNNYLYHRMLLWGIEAGCHVFDLGRSVPQSGNERFKQQYGAELSPLFSYPEKKAPGGRSKTGVRFADWGIGAWKRLPVWLSNRLGPKIRRYLPYG